MQRTSRWHLFHAGRHWREVTDPDRLVCGDDIDEDIIYSSNNNRIRSSFDYPMVSQKYYEKIHLEF